MTGTTSDKLRQAAAYQQTQPSPTIHHELLSAAADEMDALRALLREAVSALDGCYTPDRGEPPCDDPIIALIDACRVALS